MKPIQVIQGIKEHLTADDCGEIIEYLLGRLMVQDIEKIHEVKEKVDWIEYHQNTSPKGI